MEWQKFVGGYADLHGHRDRLVKQVCVLNAETRKVLEDVKQVFDLTVANAENDVGLGASFGYSFARINLLAFSKKSFMALIF